MKQENNDQQHNLAHVGLVIIGRNEGDRLKKCLMTLPEEIGLVVYVDSDSSDNSVEFAKKRGVEVVSLDISIPFTAARARNSGFERVLAIAPHLNFVQFIDGDCEVLPKWFESALAAFDSSPNVVAVCGWRRERYPERTPYNCICDVEWRISATGEVRNFGGDVMLRVDSLKRVKGYDSNVIAAEDDELSIRLRRQGGKIVRLDQDCTFHDADMTRASQWWRRAKRCGHGYAHLFALYGAAPEYYFRREFFSALFWGAALPLTVMSLSILVHPAVIIILGAYPLMALRNFRYMKMRGFSNRESFLWCLSCAGSKFPQVLGILAYLKKRLFMKRFTIIEYK